MPRVRFEPEFARKDGNVKAAAPDSPAPTRRAE